jgi:hypothetical protein
LRDGKAEYAGPTEEAKHDKLGREGSGEVQGRGWERWSSMAYPAEEENH